MFGILVAGVRLPFVKVNGSILTGGSLKIKDWPPPLPCPCRRDGMHRRRVLLLRSDWRAVSTDCRTYWKIGNPRMTARAATPPEGQFML
ncbi:Hypothetical predicted protein [Cloeon dipterum]|uniref:Uncharacterized protein n=1 Tax=Cloeon dipterum TaxID=197152 RepID=A0A8S1C0W9_9INSE|nr:Hypothetical predicted protein [Cloeon dipterum]